MPPSSARTKAPPSPARVEVFRPTGWLRWPVLVAMGFWVAVFFELVGLKGVSSHAFLGAAFFIALFSLLAVFYHSNTIEVTSDGVIERGLTSFRLVRFRDIVRVDVKPGLLQTSYTLLARQGALCFTSLFGGHRRLVALIIERSRLARL